jgi:four helix bundle protein
LRIANFPIANYPEDVKKIDGYKSNLLERARHFAVKIILISSQLPKDPAGFTIADQLVRAATSIGANIIEAQEAVSAKDFLYKMSISSKEAKETLYWLQLVKQSQLLQDSEVAPLLQESEELVRILISIVKKLKEKQK